MRRMDWKHVQESYDTMVTEACERILATKARTQELTHKLEQYKASEEAPVEESTEPSNILHLPIH